MVRQVRGFFGWVTKALCRWLEQGVPWVSANCLVRPPEKVAQGWQAPPHRSANLILHSGC
eukprot:6474187-Karenia_brevis.AAC.1